MDRSRAAGSGWIRPPLPKAWPRPLTRRGTTADTIAGSSRSRRGTFESEGSPATRDSLRLLRDRVGRALRLGPLALRLRQRPHLGVCRCRRCCRLHRGATARSARGLDRRRSRQWRLCHCQGRPCCTTGSPTQIVRQGRVSATPRDHGVDARVLARRDFGRLPRLPVHDTHACATGSNQLPALPSATKPAAPPPRQTLAPSVPT